MLAATTRIARRLNIDTRDLYQRLSVTSIRAAIREQGLAALCEKLRELRPDLSTQYTGAVDVTEYGRYWETKLRGLHAFQVQATLDALATIRRDNLVLVDIGDSSGAHMAYVRALAPPGRIGRSLCVNSDPVAIQKIRAGGGDALLCRAEDLEVEGIHADLFLSFQTLEHLTDPARFLHSLATRGSADHLLITVPWRRTSRFGGFHLRIPEAQMSTHMTPEEVHVLELSETDWALLARFAGWRVVFSRIYRQYPRYSPFRVTAPLWRKLDFEGFLGLFLTRDLGVARRYTGW